MSRPARCDLTELLVDQCAHCLKKPSLAEQIAAEDARLLALPGWFAAKWPGRCASCRTEFKAGAAIIRDPIADPPVYYAGCCPDVVP